MILKKGVLEGFFQVYDIQIKPRNILRVNLFAKATKPSDIFSNSYEISSWVAI